MEKFIGDAVMAVWGTPTATEDDAERAVRAALDLVAAVSALGDEVGARAQGPRRCPHRRGGSDDRRRQVRAWSPATSSTPPRASSPRPSPARSSSASRPGARPSRRSSSRTPARSSSRARKACTSLWKALRVVAGRRGTLKSTGLEAPFVGRDRELRQIKDLFHTSADERKAHLVSVTGIAGIGKSPAGLGVLQVLRRHHRKRLVAPWPLPRLRRRRHLLGVGGHGAHALPDRRGRGAGLGAAEAAGDAGGAPARPRGATVRRAAPRTAARPGRARVDGTGRTCSRPGGCSSSAWPTSTRRVLAFEDMQWADAALLDFVEYLLEWSRDHPLYVITLARPELLERRPTWGAGHRNFTSRSTSSRSRPPRWRSCSEGLVPGLPGGSDRADPGPRRGRAAVRGRDGAHAARPRRCSSRTARVYRPVGEIESLEVPETLHALIAARLDGLSTEERRLLQDGAVLGKTFTPGRARGAWATTREARPRAAARLAGPQGGSVPPDRPALARARPVRLPAGPRPPRRLRDADQAGPPDEAPRRCRVPERQPREKTRSSRWSRRTTSPPTRRRPTPTTRTRSEGERETRLPRPAERAASLAAAAEAQRYFEQAAELTEDRSRQPALLDRAGQMAVRADEPGSRHGHSSTSRPDAYEAEGEIRSAALVSARLAETRLRRGTCPAGGRTARARARGAHRRTSRTRTSPRSPPNSAASSS